MPSSIELCRLRRRWPAPSRAARPLHGPFAGVFHGFLPGAAPGLVYGLRAHGPWAPEQGHRFNPAKLLLDPWGREIIAHAEGFAWRAEHHGPSAGPPGRAPAAG
ncbi:MAG: hypothetical protein U5L74_11650 [Ideonella sp.]|nr:hypothetical protein [Ideonella sp.]